MVRELREEERLRAEALAPIRHVAHAIEEQTPVLERIAGVLEAIVIQRQEVDREPLVRCSKCGWPHPQLPECPPDKTQPQPSIDSLRALGEFVERLSTLPSDVVCEEIKQWLEAQNQNREHNCLACDKRFGHGPEGKRKLDVHEEMMHPVDLFGVNSEA